MKFSLNTNDKASPFFLVCFFLYVLIEKFQGWSEFETKLDHAAFNWLAGSYER